MEYICAVIMKETEKIEFATREAAVSKFMEKYGDEMYKNRVKQVEALRRQIKTNSEKLSMAQANRDKAEFIRLENIIQQKEKALENLLNITEEPAFYSKRENLSERLINGERHLLLHLAGVRSLCGKNELVEEEYFLLADVFEDEEDAMVAYSHLPEKFKVEREFLHMTPGKERMMEVTQAISRMRTGRIREFIKSNLIKEIIWEGMNK